LGGVVGPVPLRVLRDVHGIQERLAALDERIPVTEVRAPLAQRLDLGAGEHEARLVRLLEVEVMTRATVGRDDLLPAFPGHVVLLTTDSPQVYDERGRP